ncbi:MAG: hypothetical protein ACRDK2_05390, partial [Solirubrobacteraceae bacterium]
MPGAGDMLMFSRGQPREVYRVYGEDDFFAEQNAGTEDYQEHQDQQGYQDQVQQPYQDQQDHQGYQDYQQPQAAPQQPEHQPQFDQQPEPVQHFAPQPAASQAPVEEYAPPTETYMQPLAPVFAGERHGGQPPHLDAPQASAAGVYGTADNHRRTVG